MRLQVLQQARGLVELVDELIQLGGLGEGSGAGVLRFVPLGVQILFVPGLMLYTGVVI